MKSFLQTCGIAILITLLSAIIPGGLVGGVALLIFLAPLYVGEFIICVIAISIGKSLKVSKEKNEEKGE